MSEYIHDGDYNGEECPWCKAPHGLCALDVAGKKLTCAQCGKGFELGWGDAGSSEEGMDVYTYATKLRS